MLVIERIDHLGIIAGVAADLQIKEQIDESLGVDDQEKISSGEAVIGMILNGLGFVSRPLMLMPQFFEKKPLELLIRQGIKPDDFNRHKLGRVLDAIAEYGTEKIFSLITAKACELEGVDTRFNSLDTTSHSLTGEYDEELDLHTIKVKHGHSKASRPDLKQVVQELVASQDGGVPLITKLWDGNASDSVIFRERAELLMNALGKTESRCLVADSKSYTPHQAGSLSVVSSPKDCRLFNY